MKRRIILSIALALSVVLVSLMNSDSSVEAQQTSQLRGTYSTGVIALTTNENLSLTITGGDIDGDTIAVRFRLTRYMKTACDSGVCRYVIESQTTTAPMLLMPNEAAKLEVMGNQIGTDRAVSIEVLSSSRNARVTVQLTDALTGQVNSVLIAILVP